MNNDANSGGGGKVFDVMRPGSVPAQPTSRPVISTTHGKPAIPDDQFVSTDAINPRPTLDKHNRISISPIEKAPQESLHSLAGWTEEGNDTPSHKIAIAVAPETRVQPDSSPLLPELPNEHAEQTHTESQATPETETPEELPPVTEPPAITPTPPPGINLPAFPDTQVVGALPSSNLPPSEMLISHHSKPMGKLFWIGIVLLAIVISLVAINFLLDADILPTTTLPHTNLI